MSGVVTYAHCGECRQRIPWGQPRYIEMRGYDVVREVCFECVQKARGRTGSAPGDTEATEEATVQPTSDSKSRGASGSLDGSLSPKRFVPLPYGPHIPPSER
jgi:hypothetical protein